MATRRKTAKRSKAKKAPAKRRASKMSKPGGSSCCSC